MSTPATENRTRGGLSELVGIAVPFGLVLYLALRGGGYDTIVRDEAATLLWVLLAIAALVGLPLLGALDRRAWIAVGLLAGLAVWTGLGALWSESAERSVEELGRVGFYLGVFVLALSLQTREDALRRTLFGVAAAIGLVAALAVLSRLHPSWFPDNEAAAQSSEGLRLNYPLNYWNGLGSLLAIGLPLLLMVAGSARSAVARSLATAAIPVSLLAIFLTFSRGAWFCVLLALVVFFVAHPRRLATLPLFAIGIGGGAVLTFAASRRDDFENGLTSTLGRDQGNEMLLITLAVCAIVVGLRLWLDRAERRGFDPLPPVVSRRSLIAAAIAAVAIVAAVAIAVDAPGELSEAWNEFKQPTGAGTGAERFTSASSNGRFEYWGAAIDAGLSEPLQGIGPGAWDLWWSREATISGFARDAHSLYLEVFAELGIVGLLLILGLVGSVLAGAVGRIRWSTDDTERALLAGGTAAAVAFAVAMGLDWGWEIAAIPCAFLFVAAALVGPNDKDSPRSPSRDSGPIRITTVAAAVLLVVALVPAMLGTRALQDSQDEAGSEELEAALDDAERAESLQPYAASPLVQQALVLQLQGQLERAAAKATDATETEPTNWRGWFTLARIENERGDMPAAEAAFEQAVALNPRSSSVLAADPSP